MDNMLAVTADLKRCSIAVKYDGQLFEINENVDAATYLVSLTRDLFSSNHLDLRKIQRLLTVSGPGSFTGIRTAQSFVKGMALGLNIPALCTDYFQVIKHLYGHGDNLIAVIRSEKTQIYYKNFRTKQIGSAPLDSLPTADGIPFVGDAFDSNPSDVSFVRIDDFKKAKYLLDITSDFNDEVKPLYLNA